MVKVWGKTRDHTQELLDRICSRADFVVVTEVRLIREGSWEAYAAPAEQPVLRRVARPLGAQLRRGHR